MDDATNIRPLHVIKHVLNTLLKHVARSHIDHLDKTIYLLEIVTETVTLS